MILPQTYVHMCMHTYVCAYVYAHMQMHTLVEPCTHTYMCTRTYMHHSPHVCMHKCIHTHVHTNTMVKCVLCIQCVFMCMCAQHVRNMHTNPHTHTHTHTYKHTHIGSQVQPMCSFAGACISQIIRATIQSHLMSETRNECEGRDLCCSWRASVCTV